MTTTKTHFSYLHDPKNYDRVITVARKVEDGVITFGVAICRPSEWVESDNTLGFSDVKTLYLKKGDKHIKAKGRMIAEARMNSKDKRLTVMLMSDEHPMLTISHEMCVTSMEMPEFVRRTFEAYVLDEYTIRTDREKRAKLDEPVTMKFV